MKDIPYSVLKEDPIGFEILTLWNQGNHSFSDIAKKCEISTSKAKRLYSRTLYKQVRLYIRHLSFVLGHESITEVKEEAWAALDCYREFRYVCIYLEKKYKGILDEYRDGEPGMPEEFVKSLPPFKRSLRKKTVSRIIEMRETEKATFRMIAKELHITPEKAKAAYDSFYYRQVLAYVKVLQEKVKSYEEKQAIWFHFFGTHMSAKKRYEMMMREKEQ